MILTDREIQAALSARQIVIDPSPDAAAFSATSVDLTLGSKIQLWKTDDVGGVEKAVINPSAPDYSYASVVRQYTESRELDSNGYVLEPKMFLLAWTHELIELPVSSRIAARVEGKSSLARLGVGVHVTAPTIHAGFSGQIQLEVFNHSPLRVRFVPGFKICQLIFEMTLGTPEHGYSGRFLNQKA